MITRRSLEADVKVPGESITKMSEAIDTNPNLPGVSYNAPEDEGPEELAQQANVPAEKPKRGRPPSATTVNKVLTDGPKPEGNKVVKLLDKNPLGMTLPEMAGGPRQIKRIKTMRPQLAEAIRSGLVMPVSQRAGHTVYRLVKHIANR
jgi:hypothetical protein